MNVLMISTDRSLFIEGSAIRSRMIEYGHLVGTLHILVPTLEDSSFQNTTLSPNVFVYGTSSSSKWGYVCDLISLGKKIKDINVVTTQDPFETGLAGLLLSRFHGACLELQIHTDFLSPYFSKERIWNVVRVFLAKRLLTKADSIRVVSERIRKSLETINIKLKTKPVVLPMFVDVEYIWNLKPKEDLRKRYGEFSFRFLMVNRLEKEKNISLALRAFKKVLAEKPNTALVIADTGSMEAQLKKEAETLGVHKNTFFIGKTNDPFSLYKTADAFLLASNYEGYGLVLVEAAASDCPIVTTDVGVAGSMLKDRESALIVPPGNETTLTKTMVEMISFPELRRKLALNAQNALMTGIKEKNKAEYLRAYKKLWEDCASSKTITQ